MGDDIGESSTPEEETPIYFDGFTIHRSLFELRRADERISIEPKVLDVLLYLIDHRTRVVTREELLAALWSGTNVGQAALTRAIREARRVLGDDAETSRIVVTVPRRGYRFVAELLSPTTALQTQVSEPHEAPLRGLNAHASLSTTQRESMLVEIATHVASARVLDDLAPAGIALGRVLGSAGTLLVEYVADALPQPLAGDLSDWIKIYRPELFENDVLHQKSLQLDDTTSPHIAMRLLSDDERGLYRRSAAYADFYRSVDFGEDLCMQLTEGRNGATGTVTLLYMRAVTQDRFNGADIAIARDFSTMFASAVERVRALRERDAIEAALVSADDDDHGGPRARIVWDQRGSLMWLSDEAGLRLPRARGVTSFPEPLLRSVHALLGVIRGEASSVRTARLDVSWDETTRASLRLGRSRTGDPVVIAELL